MRYPLTTPALDGGVSQQPPNLRPQRFVEAAENFVCEPGFGLRKRPGTLFERAFTMAGNADVRLTPWSADGDSYLVVFGTGGGSPILRVFRDGAAECTVNGFGGSDAANIYAALNSASGQNLRLRRVEDYALLINCTKATALKASASYNVSRTRFDYDAVVSFSGSDGIYVRSTDDSSRGRAGFFKYNVSGVTYSHINFPTLTTPWTIHNGYWDDTNYYPCGLRVAFRRVALAGFTAATFTTATGTITKTGAFTSYTYKPGDMIYISAGTGFSAGWYAISSRTSNDAIVIVGGPGSNNSDTAADSTDATYGETNVCRIGVETNAVIDIHDDVAQGRIVNMDQIALKLQTAIRQAGAATACVAWVAQASGGNFQITGPFRGTGAMVYAPTTPVGTIGSNGDLTASTRPFYPTGMQLFGGTGSVPSGEDDGPTAESRWTSVAAPGQNSAVIDAATMPQKLVRTNQTTFTASADTFIERPTGDQTNNPGPRIAGKKIRDVAHYKDRRVYAGESGVMSFSRTGEYTAFYEKAYDNAVDDDPFDRSLPGSDNAAIDFIEPFGQSLVVFTTGALQAEVSSAGAFTPSTASVTQSTTIKIVQARPLRSSTCIYFVAPAGDFGRLREYAYNDAQVSSQASDVSLPVPRLLPTTCRSLAVGDSFVVVLPTDDATLYLNGFLLSETVASTNRRAFSAWTTATFDGGYRICDIVFTGSDLRMLVENVAPFTIPTGNLTITVNNHGLSDGNPVVFRRSTTTPSLDGTFYVDVIDANTLNIFTDAGLTSRVNITVGGYAQLCTGSYVIETLPLGPQAASTSGGTWKYPVHLDRRVTLTGTHSAGTTTWTLPSGFRATGSTLNTVVKGPAFTSTSGDSFSIGGYGATTVTASGNYSAGACVLGRFFTANATFTRPVAALDPSSLAKDPLTLERIGINHHEAGTYTLTMTTAGVATAQTKTFTIPAGNAPEAFGTLQTSASGSSDLVVLTLSSATPHPLGISTIEYDVAINPTGITAPSRRGS